MGTHRLVCQLPRVLPPSFMTSATLCKVFPEERSVGSALTAVVTALKAHTKSLTP